MTPLSPKTRRHLDALFATPHRAAAERALLAWHEGTSERLRFAALRVSGGDLQALDEAIELGNTDWRDLLMAADFGFSTEAHETWVPRRLTPEAFADWIAGRVVDDVEFRRGDAVHVRDDRRPGPAGTVTSLVALEPVPMYAVSMSDGSRVRVRQVRLQRQLLGPEK